MAISTAATTHQAILGELSGVLWRQRALIEVLQYRLEVQRLITTSGNRQHLEIAVAEVEAALGDIRDAEKSRAEVVGRCAIAMGLGPQASLIEIRQHAPQPWASDLADHQAALLDLVAETERLSQQNRELAQRGSADTTALLAAVCGTAVDDTYTPQGGRPTLSAPPAMIDWKV